ncbi:MAG TPA: protein kinase, partial [Gemmatirosa sp.]|nr:protein kinase [Gemmatirosa sp.]
MLRELGRGGMAVVYLARERGTGEEVALKVVAGIHLHDPEAIGRFAREARVAATLRHPNIVRTLAIEEHGERALAIVTAYVHGETLRSALRREGALSFATAASVLRDVAAALAHAHAERIVHRDVKPENVFLDERSGRALLADFGIARPLDGDTLLTAHGAALGTPTYMAPEQIVGRAVDERTDVYALGLVGWEMLAGQRPWQGDSLYGILHRQQHEPLPDLALVRPDIPTFLHAAISGAIAKRPEARWRDGADFLSRLTPTPVALPTQAASSADAPDEHTLTHLPTAEPARPAAWADAPGPQEVDASATSWRVTPRATVPAVSAPSVGPPVAERRDPPPRQAPDWGQPPVTAEAPRSRPPTPPPLPPVPPATGRSGVRRPGWPLAAA